MSSENVIKNINSECQVVHFAWDREGDSTGDLENLSLNQMTQSTPHDLSRYISSVSYQKRMEDAAGEFEIVIQNTKDWKDVIKKGSWVIVYMSQDGGLTIPTGNQKPVVLQSGGTGGDPVSISGLVKQRPKTRFIGYGMVYEETEIWHNQILFDKNLLESSNNFLNSQQIKTVDGLLDTLHRLFYSPSDLINRPLENDSLTSLALQWLLPSKLFTVLGVRLSGGKRPYYGNIPGLLKFDKTVASFPVENPLSLLNGIAWDRLKAHSLDPFHELFAELDDDGLPKLNFRMLPWKLFNTNRKFPTLNPTIKKFGTTGKVKLDTVDIVDWDLGEDNHTRFNAYLTTVITNQTTIQTSLEMLGDNDPKTGFPRLLQNGIRRHGLRLLYREMNALVDLGQEKADSKLLREFNEFAVELWARSHDYESGTMSIVGNNGIRLGKCIETAKGAPYNSEKIFYIEGYEDSFVVEENGAGYWSQSLFLSRGIEKAVLDKASNINNRVSPYTNDGEFTEK